MGQHDEGEAEAAGTECLAVSGVAFFCSHKHNGLDQSVRISL
jgi:hypothetical protein